MSQALARSFAGTAQIIHEDIKALFDFLYGTQERSRVTVLASLVLFACCALGSALSNAMQAHGTCGL